MSFSGNISAPLSKSLLVSARGMDAQGARFLAISQNLANASTRPTAPGQMPYRRKLVSYTNRLDFKKGINLIHLKPMQFVNHRLNRFMTPLTQQQMQKGMFRIKR
jgi:flagellar basal body rod protein FlgC